MNTESKQRCTDLLNQALDMKELKHIVDNIFDVDINNTKRTKENIEARMVFTKILRDRGITLASIGKFLKKDHCSIINYSKNFDVYFSDNDLKYKYESCRDAFIQKRPVDSLYLEREKLSKQKDKFKRFGRILDIMSERTPYGKEDVLERKIISFLNGI